MALPAREETESEFEQAERRRRLYIAAYREHEDVALTPDDYRRALGSQGACNMNLATEFTEVARRIQNQEGMDFDWAHAHPIVQLYLVQLNHLARQYSSIDTYRYEDCTAFCIERSGRRC